MKLGPASRRLTSILDQLSPSDRQLVMRSLNAMYPVKALSEVVRSSRYRDRRRHNGHHERVTDGVTVDVTVGERNRHASVTDGVTVGVTNPPQTPPVSLEHQVLGFSSFWSKYPKRVGKAAALKAWKKNGCESNSAKILEALEKQHGYLTREGGKFIPNPATWLNEGRWDDEPPMTLPGVSKHAQATIKNLEAFVQGKSS